MKHTGGKACEATQLLGLLPRRSQSHPAGYPWQGRLYYNRALTGPRLSSFGNRRATPTRVSHHMQSRISVIGLDQRHAALLGGSSETTCQLSQRTGANAGANTDSASGMGFCHE